MLKSNNLKAFRTSGDELEEMMVGPCDYFGNLSNVGLYEYCIDIDDNGVPQYLKRRKQAG